MLTRHRNKLVGLVVVLVVAVGAAGALAATGALSPREESEAVIDDAAERLGVQPSELSSALEAALKARVDAAVEAGRLTEAQGSELKARIDAGDVPLVGLGPGARHHGGPGFGHGVGLEAAASYLGLSEAELRTALEDGQTLAQVAATRDKPVGGLVDALVAAATEELEQAVEDGRLTEAQKDSIAATLVDRVTAKVNGRFGPGRGERRFGPPPGLWGGPPGEPDQESGTTPSGYVA
jgi:hypothetical protein